MGAVGISERLGIATDGEMRRGYTVNVCKKMLLYKTLVTPVVDPGKEKPS
jgi:hypothetical protein